MSRYLHTKIKCMTVDANIQCEGMAEKWKQCVARLNKSQWQSVVNVFDF